MNNRLKEFFRSKKKSNDNPVVNNTSTVGTTDEQLNEFVKSIEDNSDKLELRIINDLILYQNVLEGQGANNKSTFSIPLSYINFLNNDDEICRGILSTNTSKEMDMIKAYRERRDSSDSKIVIYLYNDTNGKADAKPAILDLKKWKNDGINISVLRESITLDLETIHNFLDINYARKREVIRSFDENCYYYADYVYYMIYESFYNEYIHYKENGMNFDLDSKILKTYLDIENKENCKKYLKYEDLEKLRRYKFYSNKEVYYVIFKNNAIPIHLDDLKELFMEDQSVRLICKDNSIEAQIKYSDFEKLIINADTDEKHK